MDRLNKGFQAKTPFFFFFTVCNLYSDTLQAGECTNHILYAINIKNLTAHKLFITPHTGTLEEINIIIKSNVSELNTAL